MGITKPDNHQERRNLLIDATITAIAEFGLSKPVSYTHLTLPTIYSV